MSYNEDEFGPATSSPRQEASLTPQRTVKALIRKGEEYYFAECVEIAVVTQGKTLDETLANLQEAVALHLEGEDPAEFGLGVKRLL